MGFSWKWCMLLIPAILASFAFTTGILFSFWCQSILFVDETSSTSSDQAPTYSFGPWYQLTEQVTSMNVGGETKYFISDTCVVMPSDFEADSYLKTVRAFTIMTPIIGGLLTVGLWLAPCSYRFSDGSWKSMAMMFIVLLPLFQGLTFLIYNSSLCLDNSVLANTNNNSTASENYSTECQWDQGSTTNVIAVVLWFLTGVTMMLQGCPKRPPTAPPETQAVTYQQTTNADGSTTVAEVAVVKGTAVPMSVPPESKEDNA